jgi:dTDP-4-amino-4,6-dideoxygalactose transaminase
MLPRIRPYIDLESIFSALEMKNSGEQAPIEAFETEFAKSIRATSAYAFNQGRTAFYYALKSIGFSEGDEILVQSLICQTVIDIILELGGRPVLVDNSPKDFNISATDLERKFNKKTKAIVVVHMYGIPADMNAIRELAKNNSCYIIEDCAHTVRSSFDGISVGNFGDVSFFSLNIDKPFSTGNGGLLINNNPELENELKKIVTAAPIASINIERRELLSLVLQFFMMEEESYSQFLPFQFSHEILTSSKSTCNNFENLVSREDIKGIKKFVSTIIEKLTFVNLKRKILKRFGSQTKPTHQRMNNLRSKIGLAHLRKLPEVDKKRVENTEYYQKSLASNQSFEIPVIPQHKKPIFLRYTITNRSNRAVNEIIQSAWKRGIELSNHNWTTPIHLLPNYQKRVLYERKTLKNSEELAENLIHLPTHYFVSEMHREEIVNLLSEIESS